MSKSPISEAGRVYRRETLDVYREGVERAIEVMVGSIEGPVTIDDLADAVCMSRHHFTRVFVKETGVSPARFLAALRMQEAKRLLLKTDSSVTDICFDVGYSSVGTFTRIFADFVGYAPVRFRQLSLAIRGLPMDDFIRFRSVWAGNEAASCTGVVRCDRPLAVVTVALFPTSIPRSLPAECTFSTDAGRFRFSCCPGLKSYVFAAGLVRGATIEDALLMSHDYTYVGVARSALAAQQPFELVLRKRQPTEPPVVVGFPLLIAESLVQRA
ncbi:MAG TPA: helix-turn-helix transcriptional regulator [Pirellulaceae bacterium]|jgi:AraC-like DNA-binding protein|nr:helix-turn-helix transcriptional regulator [Pirellulaceae bacterium]